MNFKFKTVTKSGIRNKDWNIEREMTHNVSVRGSHNRYIMGVALLEGDINYFADSYNAAWNYVHNIRPQLLNHGTYDDLYINFNIAPPKDSLIRIIPVEGRCDILERRGGYYLTINNGGDVVATNISANSSVYFNAIIRSGNDSKIEAQSIIDHIIGDLFWREYMTVASNIVMHDIFAGTLRNRQLMRQGEMRSLQIRLARLLGEQQLAIEDLKRIPQLVEHTHKFVDEVVKPYMDRRFLNLPILRHKVNRLNWYTNEDLVEAFIQRLLFFLPDKDWMNVYSLDGIVPLTSENKCSNYRDAIGAGQKFVLTLRPPNEPYNLGHPLGYTPALQRTVGLGTTSIETIMDSEEFVTIGPNAVANVTYGNMGVYQAAAAGGIFATEADMMAHVYANPVVMGNLQPQIQVAVGKDTVVDECKILLSPMIVPPTSLILRILGAIEDKQGLPTFVDIVWPQGGHNNTYKCLILPETGITMKATPRISRSRILTGKTEGSSFEGQYYWNFIDGLRGLAPQHFEWEKQTVTNTESTTLAALIGI